MNRNKIFSKDFTLVVSGQIISIFGNQILRYALPLYLLNLTGSAALFGTILAVSFVPMLLIYPVGGIIADRWSKRNIVVILDFATALLTLTFYLLSGRVDIVLLMAVTMTALYGIQGAYQPAVQSSIPLLVTSEYIMQGNSIINTITSLASMIGPVAGGIFFSLAGLEPILYVSICCFAASAVLELFIDIPYEKKKAAGSMLMTGINDLKSSFRFMFRERPVLWKISVIYGSTSLFLTALMIIAVPVIITQYLGFAPDTANRLYGYAQGIIAAGAVAGGLLAGLSAKSLKATACPVLLTGCVLSVLLCGGTLHILKTPMSIYFVLSAGAGLLVALSTVVQIQVMTFVQVLTPENMIGKVISCVICLCMCMNPVGQFIYGMVFERISSRLYLPFYVAALLMLGVIIFTRSVFYGLDDLAAAHKEKVTEVVPGYNNDILLYGTKHCSGQENIDVR